MSISRTDRPALILIDIQKGFDNIEYWGGQRNNRDAEKYSGELLRLWRKHNLPIFHIKHCSSNPNLYYMKQMKEMISRISLNRLTTSQ